MPMKFMASNRCVWTAVCRRLGGCRRHRQSIDAPAAQQAETEQRGPPTLEGVRWRDRGAVSGSAGVQECASPSGDRPAQAWCAVERLIDRSSVQYYTQPTTHLGPQTRQSAAASSGNACCDRCCLPEASARGCHPGLARRQRRRYVLLLDRAVAVAAGSAPDA
jgi:hypothetical protein